MRTQRRMFVAGSLWLFVVAALHVLGHVAPEPPGSDLSGMIAQMRSFHVQIGPGRPSMWDLYTSLSLTMTATLILWGILGLVIARLDGPEGRIVRAAAITFAFGLLVLVALFAAFAVPPPAITLGVGALMFVISAMSPKPTPQIVPEARG